MRQVVNCIHCTNKPDPKTVATSPDMFGTIYEVEECGHRFKLTGTTLILPPLYLSGDFGKEYEEYSKKLRLISNYFCYWVGDKEFNAALDALRYFTFRQSKELPYP